MLNLVSSDDTNTPTMLAGRFDLPDLTPLMIKTHQPLPTLHEDTPPHPFPPNSASLYDANAVARITADYHTAATCHRQATGGPQGHSRTPTVKEAFTRESQRQFRLELAARDPRILAKLDQPFGKDNLTQCFRSEASLRHVLLPLWKSGFLYQDTNSWQAFSQAYYPVALLHSLLEEYGDVDFSSLQGFPAGWEAETEVNRDRAAMVSAALLHFNGSAADLVRWIGGPHVGAHRDHSTILNSLTAAGLPPDLVATLSRIFHSGIPAYCNADATEANFAAFYHYGNHASVDEDKTKTYQAMVKDNKRGFTLLFDPRLVLFLLHCHVTPQGLIDLLSLYKNPRPIFDSSFRPFPWCFAINDWTSKTTEPPLTFALAELRFMIWVYNLRITYPWLEIYLADDDVSGAYRWLKYHPNLVALHTSMVCGFACLNTGGTFGDNTTPSNFDPIAHARRLLAQYLWLCDLPALTKAATFLPALSLAPSPAPCTAASFSQADRDSLNPGVLDSNGQRLPPHFDMHVDDNLYADVAEFLPRSIQASVASLFELLGYPDNPDVPPALSFDKLTPSYNHRRRLVGRQFDSRTMTVGILPYKRAQLIELLTSWTTLRTYSLLDLASLLGTLDNHTRYTPWARSWYFALQNSSRYSLLQRHHILKRRSRLFQAKEAQYRRVLPTHLFKRLGSLISRDKARLLWAKDERFTVDPLARSSIHILLAYLQAHPDPWCTHLGFIVPRVPHFYCQGDASHVGGGAHCPHLEFWTDLAWSTQVVKGLRFSTPKQPGYLHINCLEYVMVIIQSAAVAVRLSTASAAQLSAWFPSGPPHIPYYTIDCDNQVSVHWDNSLVGRGTPGQNLLSIESELTRMFPYRRQVHHLAGELNVVADAISRNDFSLSFSSRSSQLFATHPSLAKYDYFLPSPELLQLLSSRLFSGPVQAPCALPANLGRFVPTGSTISSSPSL